MALQIKPHDQAAFDAWARSLQRKQIDLGTASDAELRSTLSTLPPELRRAPLSELRAAAKRLIDPGQTSLGHGGTEGAGRAGTAIGVFASQSKAAAGQSELAAPRLDFGGKEQLTVAEFVRAADEQQSFLQAALTQVRQLAAKNRQDMAALEGKQKETLALLAEAFLPELSQAAFERAAKLAGYPNLRVQFPVADFDRQRQAALQRLGEIERDPLMSAPRNQAEADRIKRELAKLEPALSKMDGNEDYTNLKALGYDTKNYQRATLSPGRIGDGWARDRVLAEAQQIDAFKGVTGFAALSAKVEALRAQVSELQAAQQRIAADDRRRAELVAERDRLRQEPESTLRRARAQLADFLKDADAALLGPRLEGQPELDLFRRADGLAHQLKYLRELDEKKLGPQEQEILREAAALKAQVTKARGAKAKVTVPAAAVAQSFGGRAQVHASRLDSYRGVQTNVANYNTYNTSSGPGFFEMYFWWNVFNPHTTVEHHHHYHDQPPPVVSGGGGDFGGGGAGGSWDAPPAEQHRAPESFFDNPVAGVDPALLIPLGISDTSTQGGAAVLPDPLGAPAQALDFDWSAQAQATGSDAVGSSERDFDRAAETAAEQDRVEESRVESDQQADANNDAASGSETRVDGS